MQGTQVQSLVWEDPISHRATNPRRLNCWVCALEPLNSATQLVCSSSGSLCVLEPVLCKKRSLTPKWRVAQATTRESLRTARKTQCNQEKRLLIALGLVRTQLWRPQFSHSTHCFLTGPRVGGFSPGREFAPSLLFSDFTSPGFTQDIFKGVSVLVKTLFYIRVFIWHFALILRSDWFSETV